MGPMKEVSKVELPSEEDDKQMLIFGSVNKKQELP